MMFEVGAKHETATDELSEWALLYSLGMLDQQMASGFEQHLESGCAVCESELRGFNEAAAQMVFTIPEAAPDPRVREKLLARTKKDRPHAAIVRAEEGEWKALPYPGVSAKLLFFDRETGFMTSLVRMAPGAVYPSHNHVSPEHSYVLEGDVRFEDHTLQPGDYEVALPSTAHTSITTTNGCMLLIINNADNLRAMRV